MARPARRFIGKLTRREIQKLESLKDRGDTPRIRHRAHAILLSFHKTKIDDLASIFQTKRATIGGWLDRWDAERLDGLADKKRPGAPPKLTESEQALAVELLEKSPHNPAAVLPDLKRKIGKEISRSTLKRIAKKAGFTWKRMRKSLGNKRDQKNLSA